MTTQPQPVCPRCNSGERSSFLNQVIFNCGTIQHEAEITYESQQCIINQRDQLLRERDKAIALVASYDRQDELIGTEFEGVDEVTEVIRLLKEERDQLRAEIGPLRELVGVDARYQSAVSDINHWKKLMDAWDENVNLRSEVERLKAENLDLKLEADGLRNGIAGVIELAPYPHETHHALIKLIKWKRPNDPNL